ncbi:unnamed protein product [Cladocopium goreaui]|uniref:SAM domain-containing protein n=1 Tax=Cladocopium goreaui TaxID=2562237 RepID=A0A9P1CWW0_9DINO|nr:unnamed protein product [Cladocopium goreaui]
MLIHFGSFCLSRSQLRRGEDCPRARSLGPALRDPFSSTATIERAKETRAVQIRNRTDHHFDCACYVCGNPVRQTKLFLAASMDGSLVPSCSLPAEVRSPELENQGNVGNAPTERDPRDKVSKLDSGNIQQSLHSAVGNFLSLLGIPQYADQFMDLGLENLVTLSRLSDEGLVKETEKISFLPGHRARLLRGVLVLREASLIRVREQASKIREKALLACLAERNQDLAQEVSQLDLKLKTLQAQNVDYAQQLNHFRSQAAELEVKAKMQAEHVRFLTEKLEEHLTGRTIQSVGDDVAAISRQCITAGVPVFAETLGFDGAKARTKETSSGQNQQSPNQMNSGSGSDSLTILGVHRESEKPVPDASLTFEQIACHESGLGSPGRFEVAEFLMEMSRKEPKEPSEPLRSLSFPIGNPYSFLPVAVLLVIYLHRICRISSSSGSSLSSSQPSRPSLPVTERNWQRLLFTLLRRAEKEHLHLTEPEECSDLYSKKEICSFDQVVHDRLVDWSVSRKDAVAALDILGFSLPVEDLHLSFQN